jgi:hypothetical protein
MWEIAIQAPFTEQSKRSLTRIERGVGGPSEQLSKRTSTLECLVWETGNRTHKCWCSRYSTHLKASFTASLIRTTVFSCANIIAKGFSNDQLAFGLADKTCHWDTGVMVADNGPLYTCRYS